MEKGNSFIKTEDIMMEIGRKIKCMDGANSTMRVGNWLMKEIGHMMNFMVMAKFIMITLSLWPVVSITPILIYCKIIGNSTRACLPKILNKVEEGSSSLTKKYSREIFMQTAFKALGNFWEKMGQLSRVSGETPA